MGGADLTRMPWVNVEPPHAAFRCAMPGQPRVTAESRLDFDGTPQHATVGRLEVPGRALFGFSVVHSENGITPNPLRAARAEAGADEDGDEVVHSQRSFRYGGFPMTDVVMELPDAQVTVYLRMALGRSRVYTAFLAVPTEQVGPMQPTVEAYFRSLTFDPREAPSPAGDGRVGAEWRYIYPPEADFAVLMPGDASFEERQARVGQEDVPILTYQVRSEDGRFSFSVQTVAYGHRPPEGTMDAARRGVLDVGLALREEHDAPWQGYAARALIFEGEEEVLFVRYYVTNSRLYTVAARLPKDREERYAEHVARFFQSFRIL